ncbi:MAG: hypothetical protein FJX52_11010, partial [Alphaproteobacteria bacterium]|nr:hypothetical protein [Alphaproteobacteria bacterium]
MGRLIRHGDTDLVVLRDGDAVVDIAPAIGGSIAGFAWRRGDRRWDWLRPTPVDMLRQGRAGGLASFPLVPYSNRVRGGRFAFAGRAV